jgi:hypothetical protein
VGGREKHIPGAEAPLITVDQRPKAEALGYLEATMLEAGHPEAKTLKPWAV